MTAKAAPVPVALTEWPVLAPAVPLSLFELTGRASELRSLLPPPLPSAWQTAQAMLATTTSSACGGLTGAKGMPVSSTRWC